MTTLDAPTLLLQNTTGASPPVRRYRSPGFRGNALQGHAQLGATVDAATRCGPTHPLTELMILPADTPPHSSDPVPVSAGSQLGVGRVGGGFHA